MFWIFGDFYLLTNKERFSDAYQWRKAYFQTVCAFLCNKPYCQSLNSKNWMSLMTQNWFVKTVSVRLTADWQPWSLRHSLLDEMSRKGFRFSRMATPVRDRCKQWGVDQKTQFARVLIEKIKIRDPLGRQTHTKNLCCQTSMNRERRWKCWGSYFCFSCKKCVLFLIIDEAYRMSRTEWGAFYIRMCESCNQISKPLLIT